MIWTLSAASPSSLAGIGEHPSQALLDLFTIDRGCARGERHGRTVPLGSSRAWRAVGWA